MRCLMMIRYTVNIMVAWDGIELDSVVFFRFLVGGQSVCGCLRVSCSRVVQNPVLTLGHLGYQGLGFWGMSMRLRRNWGSMVRGYGHAVSGYQILDFEGTVVSGFASIGFHIAPPVEVYWQLPMVGSSSHNGAKYWIFRVFIFLSIHVNSVRMIRQHRREL